MVTRGTDGHAYAARTIVGLKANVVERMLFVIDIYILNKSIALHHPFIKEPMRQNRSLNLAKKVDTCELRELATYRRGEVTD